MKKYKVAWSLLGGIGLGLSLALCLAVADKEPDIAQPDWSRLKLVGYPNGATGIFDPETSRLYLYDANAER